jgi:hypothetical protein
MDFHVLLHRVRWEAANQAIECLPEHQKAWNEAENQLRKLALATQGLPIAPPPDHSVVLTDDDDE